MAAKVKKQSAADEDHSQRVSRLRAMILRAVEERKRVQGPSTMYEAASEVLKRIKSLRSGDHITTNHPASPKPPALCETCCSLGLSKENFLIPTIIPNIKPTTEQDGLVAHTGRWAGPGATVPGTIAGGRSDWTSNASTTSVTLPSEHSRPSLPDTRRKRSPRPKSMELGDLQSILHKSQRCDFCRLIWQSVQDQIPDADISLRETRGFAIWKIDGRSVSKLSNNTDPLTRHIQLQWSTERLHGAYVVLVGNDLRVADNRLDFLGRRLREDRDMFGTIRDWVQRCTLLHDACKTPVWEGLASLSIDSSATDLIFLLDVFGEKITPLRPGMTYTALSHVWGPDGRHLRSTEANFLERQVFGMKDMIHMLPITIRDAIQVTKNIGCRYIWVDCLCIIHGAGDKTADMRSIMSNIYANAWLTICAATTARQENHGLRIEGPRPDSQMILHQSIDESFMLRYPVESYIGKSEWNTTMWTFQDRYLSRRCLIFSEGRVWFQCMESCMSEDVFEPFSSGWASDMLRSPGQTWSILRQPNSGFSAYMSCVESYTRRRLDYDQDILIPLKGATKIFKAYLNTDFACGLPTRILDLAMLWVPGNSLCSRNDRRAVPSWSWAGWTGPISYDKPVLDGVMDDIWNWMEQHTWIFWFWGDEQGNVFPIETRARGQGNRNISLGTTTEHLRAQINFQSLTPAVKKTKKWPVYAKEALYKVAPALDVHKVRSAPIDIDAAITEHFPGQLKFLTWSAFFCLERAGGGGDIHRYNVLDRHYDVCGSIVLPQTFINTTMQETDDLLFEFIAISEAKTFTHEEMPIWTRYIPEERENSEWDLWYVILVEAAGTSRQRVAVGKVYRAAFHQSFEPGMDWREFSLS